MIRRKVYFLDIWENEFDMKWQIFQVPTFLLTANACMMNVRECWNFVSKWRYSNFIYILWTNKLRRKNFALPDWWKDIIVFSFEDNNLTLSSAFFRFLWAFHCVPFTFWFFGMCRVAFPFLPLFSKDGKNQLIISKKYRLHSSETSNNVIAD